MSEATITRDETLAELRAEVRELRALLVRLGHETMRSMLEAWRARIDNLWVQADLGRMEVRDEVRAALTDADRAWQTSRDRLLGAAAETGDVRDALVEGLESARSDLSAAVALAEERMEAGRR
jgi:hypothetical protein